MDTTDESPKTNTKSKPKFQRYFKTPEERKTEREQRRKRKARIIIRNLNFTTTAEKIQEHFGKFGSIQEVNLLKRNDGKLLGCAFIQFEKVNDALKAILKCTGKEFNGRIVQLDWAVGKNTYVKHSRQISTKKPADKLNESEIKSEPETDEENQEQTSLGNSSGVIEEDIKSEEESDKYSENESDDDDEDEIKIEKDDDEDVKPKIRRQTNDVAEGCTVFFKNVPFDATKEDLENLCKKFGPLYYALITVDKISGHSKGTAFVKFKEKASADMCLVAGMELRLFDEILQPHLALSRQDIQQRSTNATRKEPSDSRNLYLAKEGLIVSGSTAAEGVSPNDMAKRHRLEQVKNQMLKNFNRFVSKERVSIHNVPMAMDSAQLRKIVENHVKFKPNECRIMRENRPSPGHPLGKSKSFAFVSFQTHRDALACLRKLNNNPNVFGKNNRPIVSFTIEDKTVHNIKQKRLERSREKNPMYQQKSKSKSKTPKTIHSANVDVKLNVKKPTVKSNMAKIENNNPDLEYSGMQAEPGTGLLIRPKWKLREQASEHKKTVKAIKKEKRKQKQEQMLQQERKSIDHPKKRKREKEVDNFSFLVDKYKKMIDSNGGNAAETVNVRRKKWYVE